VETALAVSIIFELFWLDLIPAGTFIPPNAAAANLGALAIIHFFGFRTPSETVFPILLCLPLGWVGARVEDIQRRWQGAGYERLLAWSTGHSARPYPPGRILLSSVLQSVVLDFVFFTVAVVALIALVGLLTSHGLLRPPRNFLSWGHLWIAASFGGVMSLRSERAYSMLAAGIALVTLVSLL
jgi:PTS system mannose-specific IIC component